jgi:hypothetical protein
MSYAEEIPAPGFGKLCTAQGRDTPLTHARLIKSGIIMQGDKNGRNPGQDTRMSEIEYKRHPSYIKYTLADIFIIVMCVASRECPK